MSGTGMSDTNLSDTGLSDTGLSGSGLRGSGLSDRARGFSARAVWTVARLDLTQRIRGSRTGWTVGLWLLFVYGFVALGWSATNDAGAELRAALFYGITVCVVLGLTLLIAPSLSAGSITGDREHGVLATLQTTLLTPAEIALGKLLAAWLAALAFLALAVPVLLWALLAGGVSAGSLVAALATIALALLAVSAVGLAISALSARTISSVVLTYVVTGFLVLGMPLLFALTFPMVSSEELVRVRTYAFASSAPLETTPSPRTPATSSPADPSSTLPPDAPTWPAPSEPEMPECREVTALRTVTHTERTWWLLAPNPFVVLADIAPERPPTDEIRRMSGGGVLRSVADGVRSARNGPPEVVDECFGYGPYLPESAEPHGPFGAPLGGPIWPVGLATYLVLTVGGTLIAIRRLRAPVRRLPPGIRIA